jgi:hypothetical protein
MTLAKAITQILPLVTICLGLLQAQTASTGPFGFHAGMSRKEAIRLVGDAAVNARGTDSNTLWLTTAPRPSSHFGTYILTFNDSDRLVKIYAGTNALDTNSFGTQLRSEFSDVREALKEKYGVGESVDSLDPGTIWSEPRDWMAGLLKEESHLVYYWMPAPANSMAITSILVRAGALSVDQWYITINYELEGFLAYHNSKKAKQNDVF